MTRRAVTHAELGRDFSVTLDMVSTAADIELKSPIAQPMTLWIQQANASYRPVNGHIHTARRLGSDGSVSGYQLTMASWMHFLHFRSDIRYWQDRGADAIVANVFDAHPQARGRYRFVLSKAPPRRSYCRQSEGDWHFVHRLTEQEGLSGFWQHDASGTSHTLVIPDDIRSLDAMTPAAVAFARLGTGAEADAFTQWAGSRTLQSSTHTTRTFDYQSPAAAANPKGSRSNSLACSTPCRPSSRKTRARSSGWFRSST